MINTVVIGLGFGDEGKGLTTSFLSYITPDSIVVRFNGGHQAGHTVKEEDYTHIFSQFGSGTLNGTPTYWSEYCTFYPPSFYREWMMLKEYNPVSYVHPLCPVTTPFDVDANRTDTINTTNGSVGMGFGKTIQRQQDNYKLFVQDLYFKDILMAKLEAIGKYYNVSDSVFHTEVKRFLEYVEYVKSLITVKDYSILKNYNCIFEGAQGVMLDMDFGIFPNVTRSNTTSKNALEIISKISENNTPQIWYVTRTYQTRHGNGFMTNEDKHVTLVNDECETNKQHTYQGTFRKSEIDYELLDYALSCDNNFSSKCLKNLVVTCNDQLKANHEEFNKLCVKHNINRLFISNGPSHTDIEQIILRDYSLLKSLKTNEFS